MLVILIFRLACVVGGLCLGLQLNSFLTIASVKGGADRAVPLPIQATMGSNLTTPTESPTPSLEPVPDPMPMATPASTMVPEAAPPPAPTHAATPPPLRPSAQSSGKRIVVSLASQSLTAYENGTVVLTTVVATGRPELPTPRGTFHIMAKYAPYKFVSPWPKGSPYWYTSAWVNYAMLYEDGGYFLHDAPWRTVYGPSANRTNGTHGCINIPLSDMTFLYRWSPIGTTVLVE